MYRTLLIAEHGVNKIKRACIERLPLLVSTIKWTVCDIISTEVIILVDLVYDVHLMCDMQPQFDRL